VGKEQIPIPDEDAHVKSKKDGILIVLMLNMNFKVNRKNSIKWRHTMRIFKIIVPILLGIVLVIFFAWGFKNAAPTLAAPTALTTIYVDADNVSGTYDGLTWTTAYTNLQDALAVAATVDWIFVAEGIYYPDEGSGATDNSTWDTFDWTTDVDFYGGFDPGSGIVSMNQRDWVAYPTVLSGDITQDDTTNAFGVLTSTANIVGDNSRIILLATGLTETAIMDGFFLTGGDSFSGGGSQMSSSSPTLVNLVFSGNSGGGYYIFRFSGDVCEPSLTNITFTGNSATGNGGGMNNQVCDPTLNNVTFLGNTAEDGGGGYYNNGSSVMKNVKFSGNTANMGGGIYNYGGNLLLTNLTISGNEAVIGGGIYNFIIDVVQGDVVITNTILWGNTAPTGPQVYNNASTPEYSYSDIQGSGGSTSWSTSLGTDGGNNIDSDPLFVRNPNPGDGDWTTHGDNDYGDLHLQFGSFAVNTGTNSSCPAFDMDGNPRPIGLHCDMGVFELVASFVYNFLPLIFR
jgi:hypothetical protein